MVIPSSISFVGPTFDPSYRSFQQSQFQYRHLTIPHQNINPMVSSSISTTLLHYNISPLIDNVPLGNPVIVIGALILAISAQSFINSMLEGDQGLGNYLSDGSGYGKSKFKARKKPSNVDDPTKPLGAGDPLPWLKLPELDFVDVAGQEKKKQKKVQPNKSVPERIKDFDAAMERDEKVLAKLESLKDRMKAEVAMGDLEEAKRIEDMLESIMKKEGYDFS